MINRRKVMGSGIAAALLARGSAASFLAAGPATAGAGRFVFVADEHLAEARAAAQGAVSLGATVRPFASDVTGVYDWLDVYLREAPAVIAGVGTLHALFAIERLAWDRGLRTFYRGVHRIEGIVPSHRLFGSPGIIEGIESVETGDWHGLGRVLAAPAREPADWRHIVTWQELPRNDDRSLASWLLAPRELLIADGRSTAGPS